MVVATSTAILVGAGIAAAGATASYFEQKKANRQAQRTEAKAARVSSATAQVQNARRRRQALAQARVAQARNVASQSEAVQTSSALSGVQSGISSGFGGNVSAQRQQVNTGITLQQLSNQRNQALRQGEERIAGIGALTKIAGAANAAYNYGGAPTDTYQGNPAARAGSFGSTPRPGQF